MPEIKRKVQTVEVNYVCDQCGNGMMQQAGETSTETGETPHSCMICGHQQTFKDIKYPHIRYIGEDEEI